VSRAGLVRFLPLPLISGHAGTANPEDEPARRGESPAPVRLRERADAVTTSAHRTPVRWFLAFTADQADLARSDPEIEQETDVWDLLLYGAAGRLSFTGARQALATQAQRRPGRSPSRG
jgi:hypothetical protein